MAPSAYNAHFSQSDGENGEPTYSSAVQEKLELGGPHYKSLKSWFAPVYIRFPGVRKGYVRVFLPNLRRFNVFGLVRFGRKRGIVCFVLILLTVVFALFALGKRKKSWPPILPGGGPDSSLVFKREDLQRIWQWEVHSGHYPSRRSLPKLIGLKTSPRNPALPPRKTSIPSRFRAPPGPISTTTAGTGPKRIYLDIQSQGPNVAYPPRPVPGSIADLDIVMEHCDYSEKKYVRDCLEVLRLGAGLDNGRRVRRGKMDEWKYIYVEQPGNYTPLSKPRSLSDHTADYNTAQAEDAPDSGFTKRRGVDWETPPVLLPSPAEYRPYSTLPSPCDPESPRVFHMFWTGPFTDKPYLALLSFLFTQNVGLYTQDYPAESAVCRPQFWLWINPGPAASVPNPSALQDMFDQLKANPWSSPFLHPRFKDVIQFKLWNTTEQLDGVPEIKDHWRHAETLFNSGGHTIKVHPGPENQPTPGNGTGKQAGATGNSNGDSDELQNRLGSKSSSSYDRMSVILSDMARFLLCHRFGGIYLDADTIFLRDWEELWGWKGAFAYRWSRLQDYNTAVLHLNKGSALGTFLFRTALKNDLDFHPMTVSRYMRDSQLEGLLLRLPDALFDSAWLNTEYYQRDRPPQPYFTEFGDFFDTPSASSAAPQALGFDGFFKGAFSYHFHNYWWKPFDPIRNFPDLGPRFPTNRTNDSHEDPSENNEDNVNDDKRDLDWATVLKRTFESYIRGERPNMYGEYIKW